MFLLQSGHFFSFVKIAFFFLFYVSVDFFVFINLKIVDLFVEVLELLLLLHGGEGYVSVPYSLHGVFQNVIVEPVGINTRDVIEIVFDLLVIAINLRSHQLVEVVTLHQGKRGVVANQGVLRLHSLVFVLLSESNQGLLGRVIDIGLKLLHIYNLALSLYMGFRSSYFQLV